MDKLSTKSDIKLCGKLATRFFNLNKGSDVKSISITKNLILSSTRIQNSMLLRECMEFMFFFTWPLIPAEDRKWSRLKKGVEWLRYTFKRLIFKKAYAEC